MEGITGTKLYDEVERWFLKPMKLDGIVPTTSRRIPGLVAGYAGPKDPLGLPDEVVQNGVFVINPQFEWTGGGYATTRGRARAVGSRALHGESDFRQIARPDDFGSRPRATWTRNAGTASASSSARRRPRDLHGATADFFRDTRRSCCTCPSAG